MLPVTLLTVVSIYFILLLTVAFFTSRGAGNSSFFIGDRNSNWVLVTFGMVGTTLSGVTFVSVPGDVGLKAFDYLQITLGYFIGYLVIAFVLLPVYYKLNLTSIYTYLEKRFGVKSYKTGASFFLLSRLLITTARLYLVIHILQYHILSKLGVPFWLTSLVLLLLITLYTIEGGVKTIVWTDTLQTFCMIAGLIVCAAFVLWKLDFSITDAFVAMSKAEYTKVFVTDPYSKMFFVKQILAGAFITIAMTGTDQEMMQKNISVRTLKNARKNMIWLAFIMVLVISLFLLLGGLLHIYGANIGLSLTGDKLFPTIALNYMPAAVSVIFLIALISSLFPSADGAITALTSSFCIDILGVNKGKLSEVRITNIRKTVHIAFSVIFLLLLLLFERVHNNNIIGLILQITVFTYGPLLGLFAFGIFTDKKIAERYVPFICIAAPLACFFINKYQSLIFGKFEIGLELIIINAAIVFTGLWLTSSNNEKVVKKS